MRSRSDYNLPFLHEQFTHLEFSNIKNNSECLALNGRSISPPLRLREHVEEGEEEFRAGGWGDVPQKMPSAYGTAAVLMDLVPP